MSPSASPRSSPPSSPPSRAQSPMNLLSSPPTSYVCPSPDCPPPPAPLPWTWTCHCCGLRYNIAVTRRCLSCGHHFCLWHVGRYGDARVAVHDVSICGIEFDYVGWRAWMEWRREVGRFRRLDPGSSSGGMVLALERMSHGGSSEELGRRASSRNHDCSIDCDYPSQCLHERYMALRECAMAGKGPGGEQDPGAGGGCATSHDGIRYWP